MHTDTSVSQKNKNTEKQEEENVSCGQNFGYQCIGYIKI